MLIPCTPTLFSSIHAYLLQSVPDLDRASSAAREQPLQEYQVYNSSRGGFACLSQSYYAVRAQHLSTDTRYTITALAPLRAQNDYPNLFSAISAAGESSIFGDASYTTLLSSAFACLGLSLPSLKRYISAAVRNLLRNPRPPFPGRSCRSRCGQRNRKP